MALTKTTKPSIIKTRAQSRTEARTGTNVRTNDDTIAPGRTTGTIDRTIGSVDPVAVVNPVAVDAAGRTTTLKAPPPAVPTGLKPAPRNRDSDSDSGAKKPAAKPKGRPKKVVAPKATTRKPCKPRVDANELVDPMANIHVGDATGVVTAAGGLARAGGKDPVLVADMNPNPTRLGVLLARLARIAPATVMMTMMRTPTAP